MGLANPPHCFTQDETFQLAGYTSSRVLEIFRNCGIDDQHFYVKPGQKRDETPDELNERYLRGAMETDCQAIAASLRSAHLAATDVDLLVLLCYK
jgi:predicted naringenin-chalcone synthase